MSSQFQPYLDAIATAYAQWWERYTLTNAQGREKIRAKPSAPFDFGLIVQTVNQKERREEERREEEKIECFPVLEGIRKYAEQHILLVGRPGSGKSTALARLLLEEATTPQARIPVLVELRYWQGSIEQLIRDSFIRHDLPAESVDAALKRALILFDGVNELPSEEARSQLSAFRRNHPNLPMIFTTRDLSLGGDLGIEKKLEMQPLTETQMQAFVRSYVPEQAEEMLRQLNDRLREFGQTPLLLWMLCEVIQQTPDSTLPTNLGSVFKVFTEAYEQSSVRKHEVAALKGDTKSLSDRRLWKKALKALAFLMMQGETPVDFRVVVDRNEAERELSRVFPNEQFPVRDILDDLLKYHLLQNRSVDQIEFRHQLIQEYYAAEALLEQLPKLDDERLKREHLNYLKWTEPIALMLELVEDEPEALRVVQSALDVDLMLGAKLAGKVKVEWQGRAIEMVRSLQLPQLFEIYLLGVGRSKAAIPVLIDLLKHKDAYVRGTAAFALGEIGSDIVIQPLIELLKDEDDYVRWKAADGLGEAGSEAAIPSLTNLLKDGDIEVRDSGAVALSKIGSEAVIQSLMKLFKDGDAEVCKYIAIALGEIGTDAAIPLLTKLATSKEVEVRGAAASELGKIRTDASISLLVKLLKDENSTIRGVAAYSLGEIGSDVPVSPLIECLQDESYFVRKKAATSLKEIGVDSAILPSSENLKDENLSSGISAVELLHEFDSEADILELKQNLNDEKSDFYAILGYLTPIQDRCKYYNYEIFQDYLEAQKADRQTSPNSDRSSTTTNHFPNATEVKIFENVDQYHEAPPPPKDPPS